MDVRCEKCQTEYELDESRLKPGGVTVKCTNCGHMFKIRRRANTNVGAPPSAPAAPPPEARPRPPSGKAPVTNSSATVASPAPTKPSAAAPTPTPKSDLAAPRAPASDDGSGPNSGDRQWLIRLESGEQKACKELATLQQWIVAGIVSRESLISRSGKTWKRLGDIPELGQYFIVAEEAKAARAQRATGKGAPGSASTMLGIGTAGDEEVEARTTGTYRARNKSKTPPPPPPRSSPTPPPPLPIAPTPASPIAAAPTPVSGPTSKANPLAQTELATSGSVPLPAGTSGSGRSAKSSQPPPAPRAKAPSVDRNTATWAAQDIKASASMTAMPQGPSGGKLAAIPAEPAFAGRVRVAPADDRGFDKGKVSFPDDDDAPMPARSGSRAGLIITIISLLVIAGAAGVVYVFAFRDKQPAEAQKPPADGAQVVLAPADAAPPMVTPVIDAAPPPSPLDIARSDLATGVETRMQSSAEALAKLDATNAQADVLALRARLTAAIAQTMLDRAALVDKADGDKLRKQAKQLVVDAATLATKAQKAAPDDGSANLAMAEVLRLQGKPARDVRRYLDTAKTRAGDDKDLARAVALADAQLFARDGKLDDAAKALAAIDAAGDARVLTASALVALAQGKPDAAKPLVEQVLTANADHETARALQKKLETAVAKTDPLPPEDHGTRPPPPPPPPGGNGGGAGGGSYDALVASANKLAESNCTKAMEIYQKALDLKSQGVEALTGMGYCHLDAKQFASAFSNFRSALVVSPRFEPALGGIAETYQRQGNKEQAIESWKRYLEVYPASAKAKHQLEILGAGDAPAPTPTPPPTPTPTPTPTPDPAAGSGSG